METENNPGEPEQSPRTLPNDLSSPVQPRPAEKVIRPSNQNLESEHVVPGVPRSAEPTGNTASSNYGSTAPQPDATSSPVPRLDLRKTLNEQQNNRVLSMQHKSLLVLAIISLAIATYGVFSAVKLNQEVQQALLKNEAGAGTAQVLLYVLYANIIINILIGIYFIIARSRNTVATILKILLVLQIIAVFGVFWGGRPNEGMNLLMNGAYLCYIYIVLTIIRKPSTL